MAMFSNDSELANSFNYAGDDLEAMMQADNYYRWIIDTIKPFIGSEVVEVGSGVGSFSKLLLKLGPKTLDLIEPSKNTFKALKSNITSNKKTRVTAHNGYLKGVEEKGELRQVDTFVYINVMEHIDNDFGEVARVAKKLKSGGHLIVFVPALEKLNSDFDKSIGHYRRYDKKRLAAMSQKAGLELQMVRYMDMIGILPWWLSFVVMKRKGLVSPLVKIYDNLCVPVIRVVENTIPVPIGKNVLLIARKP